MTLTPEKMDEIEQLAELATPGPYSCVNGETITLRAPDGSCLAQMTFLTKRGRRHADEVAKTARMLAALDPATVRELVRLARIAAFLIETAESYGGWTGPEPSPAEFHISWGTQQHSPVFEPLAELNEAAKRWAQEQLEGDEGHD